MTEIHMEATTPSSPTLPRRFRRSEAGMIVNALRQRSQLLANLANGDTGAIGESYRRLSDRYDSLADRIRDGGPLAQRAYYGARVPLREANDRRHDRKEGS